MKKAKTKRTVFSKRQANKVKDILLQTIISKNLK